MIARSKRAFRTGFGTECPLSAQNRRNSVRVPVSYRAKLHGRAFRPYTRERGISALFDRLVSKHAEHWSRYTRHFGPPSGSDPKLAQAVQRYLFTVFGYGCNLGP